MTIYFAELHVDAEGIGFSIPDLPGFAAHYQGEDIATAVRMAETVLRDWIASNADRGIEIPPARAIFEVGSELRKEIGNETELALIGLRARFPARRALRVNLSIDERTLATIDEKAAARAMTRSAFLVEAAMAFD